MDDKLRIVKPYGRLHTMNREYFLLKPFPITKDSWQGDGCYRFLVVPDKLGAMEQRGTQIYPVYGYARHIVTTCFTIEYKHDIDDIAIPVLDLIDLLNSEEIKEDDNKDNFPF